MRGSNRPATTGRGDGRGQLSGFVGLAVALALIVAAGPARGGGAVTGWGVRPVHNRRRGARSGTAGTTSRDCDWASGPQGAGDLYPVAPDTTIGATPKAFASTDGDILAVTMVNGARTPMLAIGGDFSTVVTRDGVPHRARNFAVLDASTGAVRYAGTADSYVRAIASRHGIAYVGGDFTSFGGYGRAHAAAVSTSTGLVTAWNPAPAKRVRGITADDGGVYLTGDFGAVTKVTLRHAKPVWSVPITGGSGRALRILAGKLYAGGLFETYGGTAQHGLVKLDPADGALDHDFDAQLRADSGSGEYGSYDGEGVLSMAHSGTGRLVLGIGGRAPDGLSSNEVMEVDAATGSRAWTVDLVGDCQAVVRAGATDVAGYHRNGVTPGTPATEFAAQLNDTDGAWTTWDPALTGDRDNADGGNNGVQAMYADATTSTLFVAGAFTRWNGTATHQSLAVYTWS